VMRMTGFLGHVVVRPLQPSRTATRKEFAGVIARRDR
jgi:hypothetical protein